MTNIKRRILFSFFLLFLVLILGKSITVLISEWSFHKYKVVASKARDGAIDLDDNQLANQYIRLEKAIRWAPKNSLPYFEMGRILHRIAAKNDLRSNTNICDMLQIDIGEWEKNELYARVIENYDKAIKLNYLVKGARFWRLNALIALEENLPAELLPEDEKITGDEIIAELERAMKFEGQDPSLYLYAGNLAKKAGREDIAAEYYRNALRIRLDALETIVDNVALWKNGYDELDAIVPETAQAQERLSKAFVSHWRFDYGRIAWEKSKRLKGEPIWPEDRTNLVANPDFMKIPESFFTDWVNMKMPGVSIDFAPEKPGAILELHKAPKQYYHLSQIIDVTPGKRYRFSAEIKPIGQQLRSGAAFGFEVIHPYDYKIWSKGAGCVIRRHGSIPACDKLNMDGEGFYPLIFNFIPPQPLSMIKLRLIWKKNPQIGKIVVRKIRIEIIEEISDGEGTVESGSIDNNSNQE